MSDLTDEELEAIEARNALSTGKRDHAGDTDVTWCDPSVCVVCLVDSAAIDDRSVLLAELKRRRAKEAK